ncbi:hypothetical protein [Pseudomonas putida]
MGLKSASTVFTPYGYRAGSKESPLLAFNGERLNELTNGYLLGNGHRAYHPGLMRLLSADAHSPMGNGGISMGYIGEYVARYPQYKKQVVEIASNNALALLSSGYREGSVRGEPVNRVLLKDWAQIDGDVLLGASRKTLASAEVSARRDLRAEFEQRRDGVESKKLRIEHLLNQRLRRIRKNQPVDESDWLASWINQG